MHLLVTIVGVLAVLIGLIGLIQPNVFVALVQRFRGPTRFWFAVGFRIAIGIALIAVAPACRHPLVVRVFGGIAVLAGLIILASGQRRLDATIAWWIADDKKLRLSALFALVIGGLLIYVAGAVWP
jgi:hypothetical protein